MPEQKHRLSTCVSPQPGTCFNVTTSALFLTAKIAASDSYKLHSHNQGACTSSQRGLKPRPLSVEFGSPFLGIGFIAHVEPGGKVPCSRAAFQILFLFLRGRQVALSICASYAVIWHWHWINVGGIQIPQRRRCHCRRSACLRSPPTWSSVDRQKAALFSGPTQHHQHCGVLLCVSATWKHSSLSVASAGHNLWTKQTHTATMSVSNIDASVSIGCSARHLYW